ncbi:MAG: ATP-binding protein [Planctomycetota bacterium]
MEKAQNQAQEPCAPAKLAPGPLSAAALRWRCPPEELPFRSTAELQPVVGVIGQEGAVEALRFGLEINAPGQNIFVRGLTGTGRMTLIRRLLEEIRPACPLAKDRCYVRHFAHPDRPRLITLPRGRGREFRRRIDQLAAFIRDDLAGALSSEGMRARWAGLEREGQSQIDHIVQPFEGALREAGLALVTIQAGPVAQSALFPLLEGRPVPPEEFEQLRAGGKITEEQYAASRKRHDEFQEELREVTAKVSEIRRRHAEAIKGLRERAARSILDEFVRGIKADFPEPSVHSFLEELLDDLVTHGLGGPATQADLTRRYRVNVILAHEDDDSCPIIIENTPTMSNLLGTIERRFGPRDTVQSDHTRIRAGSLLQADGGYLILEARDVLTEPGAWKVLVRTLRTGRLEIVPPEVFLPWAAPLLKPEPIDLNVKVILLGGAETYYLLDSYDPDFPHLFKVLADFDTEIPRDGQGAVQYARVLAGIAQEEGLLPFDRSAVAVLVEHGARIAARKGKLTTRFGRLADIAREAAFIAGKEGVQEVRGDHVRQAVHRTKQRADLPSRRFRELLADGTIRVQTSGRTIGQINGLAVLQAGPLTYGFPARITATIGPGTAGVINIEREAALSGAIHTKGFYILGGLLRCLLRTDHPLAFHASLAFEQSYGGIDGDSASGAEICCLLSALTEVPLRQDLAFTGAIDQHGHILPVGAVNEKIEGFFDTCSDLGLTGSQGVIIPQANAGDLMLREDVVEAGQAGRFHVYAVQTIHEALELLTDMPAGTRDPGGQYPDGTLLGRAVDRAFEYWLKVARTDGAVGMEEPGADQPAGPEADDEPSEAGSD